MIDNEKKESLDSDDFMGQLEEFNSSGHTATVYRRNLKGKFAFLQYFDFPINLNEISQNYGGGEFLLIIKDSSGKVRARRTFFIDDIYSSVSEKKDDDLAVFEKIKLYKELFSNADQNKVLESSINTMMTAWTNIMKSQIETINLLKDNSSQDSNGGILDLIRSFIPGGSADNANDNAKIVELIKKVGNK